MPHVIRPIATVDELVARAHTAEQQAVKVLHLLDLPFGGIDPRNVIAEFNDLMSAATRLLGCEQFRDFRLYDLALAARGGTAWPAYRRLSVQHAAGALERLSRHVMDACGRLEPTVVAANEPMA